MDVREASSPSDALLPGTVTQHPGLDRLLRDVLNEAVARMLEVSRDHGPKAVFLSGSACWGEFVAVPFPKDRWHPLSDLDLFLVVERRTEELLHRLRDEMGRWFHGRYQGQFTRSPLTVGTYAASDLPFQNPTLGIAELRQTNCCLWGRQDVLERFPDPGRQGVERWELVRLLLNRSLEFVEAWGRAVSVGDRDTQQLDREYAFVKLGADLATVLLARRDHLTWGYKERSGTFSRLAEECGVPPEMAEKVRSWTAGRTSPPAPSPERITEWRALKPLDQLLPWLRWTWRSLLGSWDINGEGLPRSILRWERGGMRNRLRMLRSAVQRPPGGGIPGAVSLWWACRIANSYRTALGWSCFKFLILLRPEDAPQTEWRREKVSQLSPWIRRDEGEDPHVIARRFADRVSWIRKLES